MGENSMARRFTGVVLALPIIAALGGCTILPSPRPGYHGTGETLDSGSAFGVSIGMSQDEASHVLEARDDFNLKGRWCLKRGSEEFPDFQLGAQNTAVDCGDQDEQDIWRVDSAMAWVTLRINYHQGRVVRINWFHGEGYIG